LQGQFEFLFYSMFANVCNFLFCTIINLFIYLYSVSFVIFSSTFHKQIKIHIPSGMLEKKSLGQDQILIVLSSKDKDISFSAWPLFVWLCNIFSYTTTFAKMDQCQNFLLDNVCLDKKCKTLNFDLNQITGFANMYTQFCSAFFVNDNICKSVPIWIFLFTKTSS
jgi:hypothetical protein